MTAPESRENAASSDLFAGRFQIREKLGEGATGDVFKVKDMILKRKAAIKLLRFRNIEERKVLRFQREAKASSKLKHPGLIEVYDFGIADDGTPYLVMELIEGSSLEAVLKDAGSLDTDRALRIASLTAEAMQHAHSHKVVHRDLKPSNIMIVNSGKTEHVKVLDFGLAAILEDDGIARTLNPSTLGLSGTPNFMSPEQASKKGVDERADIYSLGCILFTLLAGRPPFIGESTIETIEQHKSSEIPSLSELVPERMLSSQLTATIKKMLAKDPAQRFQNMAEVKSAIDACRLNATISEVLVEQKPVPVPDKRRLNLIPIIAVAVIAGLAGTAYYISVGIIQTAESEKNYYSQTLENKDSFSLGDAVDFNMAASVAGDTTGKIALSPAMQLNGPAINDRSIDHILARNPKLERLSISEASVTDKCTALMVSSKRLAILNFDLCKNITDSALLPFKRMKQLETLTIRGSDGITDHGLETLAECPQLLQIVLSNDKNVTVRGVEKLAPLPKLFHIGLGGTRVKGKDLLVLNKFNHLLLLTMDHGTIDLEDAKAIKQLKFLKSLSITRCTISSEALIQFAELPELEILKMADAKGYSRLSLTRLKQKLGAGCLVQTEQPYRSLHFKIR